MSDESISQVAYARGLERTFALMDRMGSALLRASDGIENMGDHAVIGSTNDADDLKQVAQEWFEFRYLTKQQTDKVG